MSTLLFADIDRGVSSRAQAIVEYARRDSSPLFPVTWFIALGDAVRKLAVPGWSYIERLPDDLRSIVADAHDAAMRSHRSDSAVRASTEELVNRVETARTWSRREPEMLPWYEEELADRRVRVEAEALLSACQ